MASTAGIVISDPVPVSSANPAHPSSSASANPAPASPSKPTSTSFSTSSTSSAPPSASSSTNTAGSQGGNSGSVNSGDGGSKGAAGKKSLFDETPEEAAAKKDHLRKFATGDPDAIKDAKQRQLDPAVAKRLPADDSKDPFYNVKAAALADDYVPPHCEQDKEDEALTVVATTMLLNSQPTTTATTQTASTGAANGKK